MPERVVVHVNVKLVMDVAEGVSVDDVITEVDYGFTSTTKGATIVDTEITDVINLGSK